MYLARSVSDFETSGSGSEKSAWTHCTVHCWYRDKFLVWFISILAKRPVKSWNPGDMNSLTEEDTISGEPISGQEMVYSLWIFGKILDISVSNMAECKNNMRSFIQVKTIEMIRGNLQITVRKGDSFDTLRLKCLTSTVQYFS